MYISTLGGSVMGKSLMGFRTHHPEMWCLGILNTHFKLKKFEEWQEGLSGLPLKQVMDLHVRNALLISGGKGASLSPKTKGH